MTMISKTHAQAPGVSCPGVMAPLKGGGFERLGCGTAVLNKQQVSIPVFLSE
jgi:hypothetical protein